MNPLSWVVKLRYYRYLYVRTREILGGVGRKACALAFVSQLV